MPAIAAAEKIADEYIEKLVAEFEARVKSWKLNFDEEEKYTVTSGLVCRQVTLCISIARDVQMWNWDLGMMIIRLMSGVHIDFAWLSLDPQTRAKQFIEYGAGQGLLDLEHKRLFAEQGEVSEESLRAAEDWLSGQRKEMFTEVNLAGWSGLSVSKMAEEANCVDIYEGFYVPACSPLHSTWYHLSQAFLYQPEGSPKANWVPACPNLEIYPDICSLAARLTSKTMAIADNIFPEATRPQQCSYDWLRSTWKPGEETST